MNEALIRVMILPYLRKNLPSKRLGHVMGVTHLARVLARRHGLDPERATLAGLLHDAAKCWTAKKLVAYVRRHRVLVPDLEHTIRVQPHLLHAYAGAHFARTNFGVRDRTVLSAIAHHTLGSVPMTRFDKCVYVADLAAPDRLFKSAEDLRKLALRNLDRAFVEAVRIKLNDLIRRGEFIHPEAVRVWNRYVDRIFSCKVGGG